MPPTQPQTRAEFRTTCTERDNYTCLVPWCDHDVTPDPDGPGEVHHIIERSIWENGGYVPENGASVCNQHHRLAEANVIPPQAFWRWIGVTDPIVPEGCSQHTNKWGSSDHPRGETFETPPWAEHRDWIKYPSTMHLPFSESRDGHDDDIESVDPLVDIPLTVTIKMDGGNAMLVRDTENPVRARNGRFADHQSFDLLKQLYWEYDVYEALPEHLQVFGEWIYAMHSIHYGCDCDPACEDAGPALTDLVEYDDHRAYFQVFGVYDTRFDLWVSWPEVEAVASRIGFPTVPVVRDGVEFEHATAVYDALYDDAKAVVARGHEGIVVRSRFPYHYGQTSRRLAKYVRPGHVQPGETHWKYRELTPNRL